MSTIHLVTSCKNMHGNHDEQQYNDIGEYGQEYSRQMARYDKLSEKKRYETRLNCCIPVEHLVPLMLMILHGPRR